MRWVMVWGTNFQLQVWRVLLEMSMGMLTTYSHIAHHIENLGATRAVGSAIGANWISWLIPCHRVIRANGLPLGARTRAPDEWVGGSSAGFRCAGKTLQVT
jgi:AraC family transcriptional regulator of adaptative response/methylated-DNA-[protein]-cysteine methyltransferase